MKIVSVNVGGIENIEHRGGAVPTGIFKRPAMGAVRVTQLRLAGDAQADLRYHGGINKAVYAYPIEHYTAWGAEMGRDDFEYGQFGENLTTEGMLEDAVCIGDIARFGTAILQVSEPREPCYKLGIRMRNAGVIERMRVSRRCGFYLRVIEEGEVAAGDAVTWVERDAAQVTVGSLFPLMIGRNGADLDVATRALRIQSLSPRIRLRMEQIVQGEDFPGDE